MTKWDLSLRCKDGSTCKSVNITNHISVMIDKNHIIIPTEAEKQLTKLNNHS